ncbi:MAG: aminodeoxychorismate/anthranilate synthase component II [Crenarchaeota archaeon]|nr:aminodeoxychorismate/anthranilate synthase component II [Thermoproteota archaeon]
MIVLIIDNYDSFVYNIAQLIGELGARPIVVRNDEISVRGIERMRPDAIIISPGPGSPENPRDVGVSIEVVRQLAGKIPILGVCLGHQIIGYVYGSRIRRAKTIMHGKTSPIKHGNNSKLMRDVPEIFIGMRYHSLVIDQVPPGFKLTAISLDDGEIMAIENDDLQIYGIQFHPESIGTDYGPKILKNFLDLAGDFILRR